MRSRTVLLAGSWLRAREAGTVAFGFRDLLLIFPVAMKMKRVMLFIASKVAPAAIDSRFVGAII